ncbi:MAG: UDP-N-acetylmuramate dehydrogenase [Clostridium sp.]|nr:UDP-N-acetylmuramate dehydrogenase [Acetatifactor muris]MCM1527635.1 UDP-N-acetylmuramate dehydrogenase [Bacteroides sp.]MCM1563651.1 UDP-N-acetylmuramate dehydrogenase [Clostridium sp.]
MIGSEIIETLKSYVPEDNIHLREPMAAHTTFRVGGPAECLIDMEDAGQLRKVQQYLYQVGIPFIVIGNGSNLLVSDRGYQGIVLQIGQKMCRITVEGNRLIAGAGASMAQVAAAAWKNGLTGLEFASGIPGTVGGGVVMNAGAYGGEMSQVVKTVDVLDKTGEILTLDNDTMEFGYRKSTIYGRPFIVTEVTFELTAGDPDAIKAKMNELAVKRREKQPLEFPSAGSTFKRPEGFYAGELIMKAGLRGFQVGGARVSDKHCGFVVNTGNASAEDIMDVIWEVRQRVKERFQVDLEPEVIFLGEF